MISQQNQSRFNKGFSLLEVVVTVSILGILSTFIIPLYNYFNKTKANIELDNITLSIKNDFSEYVGSYLNISNKEYPISSSNKTGDVGVKNFTDTELKIFCNAVVASSKVLTENDSISNRVVETSEIDNRIYYATLTYTFKSGKMIVFKIKCIDNQYSYKDIGYFQEFTYYDKKGNNKTIIME